VTSHRKLSCAIASISGAPLPVLHMGLAVRSASIVPNLPLHYSDKRDSARSRLRYYHRLASII
jgi:hypothetical protein